MTPDYLQLARALLPETALVIGALVVLALDLSVLRSRTPERRLSVALLVAAVSVTAAVVLGFAVGAVGPVFGEVLNLDTMAVVTRAGVLALALLTLGFAAGATVPRHPAEYVALVLFAVAGLTLMCAAQQLLVVFLALELASLSLYVLAGFDKSRPESAEAALKYFLTGGMAAAFLLFGFSLLYGLTGSINLPHIALVVAHLGANPLLTVALVMIVVAFGFKAAAAPFHLWAPDAYQGAPTPSAALIASASKLAGAALFVRLLWPGLGYASGDLTGVTGGWLTIVAVLAGASMLLGNFAALAQSNVRRLLAYSAIAHAGVVLLGVIPTGFFGPGALVYYVATYGVATAGAFGVIAILERHGGCQRLEDLAGLRVRSPMLAVALLVFVLSLAGIPPLAGFFGKFAVFAAAFKVGGIATPAGWLTILAILLSAVALYYYLLILKQALVATAAKDAPPIRVPTATALALAVAVALVVGLGLFPSSILDLF